MKIRIKLNMIAGELLQTIVMGSVKSEDVLTVIDLGHVHNYSLFF